MKKFLSTILIFSTVLLVGCDDTNENNDLEIYTKQYLNTTDTIHINTFNGFTLINSKRINNKDGSVRLILDFEKPLVSEK